MLVRDDVTVRVVDESGSFGGLRLRAAERERTRLRRGDGDLHDALVRAPVDLVDGQRGGGGRRLRRRDRDLTDDGLGARLEGARGHCAAARADRQDGEENDDQGPAVHAQQETTAV